MATPADLEDFAIGFSLTEGVIAAREDIAALDIVSTELGVELRMILAGARGDSYVARRRFLAGPTGCGLCGIESLEEAMRTPPQVWGERVFSPDMIAAAVAAMGPRQSLNHETRAVHAAAFWTAEAGLVALREDVGRHNALDKLVGALTGRAQAADGLLLLTSRVSVEMVQKAAVLGASVLVAVSAPTALAIRTAERCGMTLIAIARGEDFEMFTHPHRVYCGEARHVA
jgi:FdhD protein